jgi:hypothetical protein
VVQAEAAATNTELVLRQAEALTITSDADFQDAAVTLREIASRLKDIDEERRRLTQPLDESKRRIMDLFRPALEQLDRAQRLVKACIADWTQQQERARRLREAEEAEAARKRAAQLQAQAERAAAAGHHEKAAALEGAADNITPPEIPEPAKAPGVSTRESWSAKVVDVVALIQAVAAGTVPAEALSVDMTFLNRMARALKGSLNYPGVEAVKETVVVAQTGIQGPRSMPVR